MNRILATLASKIDVSSGAYCTGTNWVNGLSRDIKENFMLVSGQEVPTLRNRRQMWVLSATRRHGIRSLP